MPRTDKSKRLISNWRGEFVVVLVCSECHGTALAIVGFLIGIAHHLVAYPSIDQRKYHPDKNPEGLTPEEAQTKFHQINVAYQILSNPTTRKKYDKEGPSAETPDKEDSGDAANVDPLVFFHVLFAHREFFLHGQNS